MWVRQSGYKANRYHLTNVLNGNVIRIMPNSNSLVELGGANTHAVVVIFAQGTVPLFIGTEAECQDAFEKLVRYLNNAARVAFAGGIEPRPDTGIDIASVTNSDDDGLMD